MNETKVSDVVSTKGHIDAGAALRELNSKEMRGITKGMSDEEKRDVVAVVDSELLVTEIERRTKNVNKMLKELTDYLATNYQADMNLVEKQNVVKRVREIVRLENGN